MRRAKLARWMQALLLVFASLLVSPAAAQSYDLRVRVDADQLAVGESVNIELSAMVEQGEMPREPQLQVPPGIRASGPNISTRTMAHFGSGRSMVRRGITATWRVVADKPGSFVFPPPTVVIAGKRVAARSGVRLLVVPSTGQSKSSQGRRRSLFGGAFSFNFDDVFDDSPPEPEAISEEARRLAVAKAPKPYAFLRLMVDKTRAVVGEQVTLSSYAYYRPTYVTSKHDMRDPPLADFLRVGMDDLPGTREPLITTVGNVRYHVALLDRVALFPLRAGKLATGKLNMKFNGPRLRQMLPRASNDVLIDVQEPPIKGRPAGYQLGDVGRFSLSAEVKPRDSKVGETVSVRVRLSGVGNLPTKLKIPQRTGVEWLAPEKTEDISVSNGKLGGSRVFTYLVRFREHGHVSLGTVELPYYAPDRKRYAVARVLLGKVLVKKSKSSENDSVAAGPVIDEDPFVSVAKPRTKLTQYSGRGEHSISPRTLALGTLTPPITVALASSFVGLFGLVRRRRREKKVDLASLAKRALRDAKRAPTLSDTAAAVERAIHFAIEASSGIKSRGLLLPDLVSKLEQCGLDESHRSASKALLGICTSLRFDPTASDQDRDELVRRAHLLVSELLRGAKRGNKQASAA